MCRKCLLSIFVLLCALSLNAQANPKKEITMLVVPRDAKVIQIAQDIAQHYPVLIVSYQQTTELLKLYAWNGEGWVDISIEDYTTGVFFEKPPKHTILVEFENTPSEEVLVPDGTWCENGNRLTTTDPRTRIHLLGLYFNFQNRHWRELAKPHGLSLADVNPGLLNITWWQHPEKRPTLDPEADMAHWLYLGITPPEPVEPVVIEEEPEVAPAAEVPAKEEEPAETVIKELEEAAPKTPVADPFSATEIPAAEVILPPAD